MKHKNGEAAILLRLVLVLSALAVLDRAALASPLRLPGSYRYEEQSDAAIPAQPTPSVLAQTTDVEVLASDSTHVVFALTIPTPVWREQVVDGKTYDRISIPGWAVTDDAGEPQVPVKRFLVGIPLGADVQVRAVKGPSESTGERVLLPAPRVVLDRRAPADPDALSTEGWQLETEFVAPSARPAAAGPYPGTVARVAEVGHIRDQRVAAIEVYPVQYDPSSGRVESYSRLELEIGFSYPAGPALQAHPASASPAFESILRDQLVNYQSARSWRGIETSAVIAPWLPPANSYRLLVADDGLYRLTYDQLAAAGLPVSTLDPRKLQVFWQGQEIAVRVIGEGDGSLGPADYLLFYGQAPHGKYARQSVYWLAYDLTNGRRMPVLDGSPLPSAPMSTDFQGHIRVEDDARYMAGLPGDDLTERWYWLNAIAPVDLPVEANLGVISPETATASLGASVFGFSSDPAVAPDHHARFYVNGHFVGEHWWDGNTTAEWVEFDLPQSYLTSLTNTLTASFPGDTGSANEFSLFDRFELTYHRAYVAENERLTFARSLTGAYNFEVGGFTASDIEVYDVSDPLTVKRITGGILSPAPAPHSVRFGHAADGPATLLALTSSGWLTPTAVIADIASDLGNPTNHAGYVVISHADFLLVAGALASYRASTGLDAMTIDVQDVYDQFNYGVSAPQAVRAFLQYAFEMWQLPPTYVVLLGDGTYDPKDNRNLGTVSYVHPYLAYVDPWLGETAADNRFVSVSGSDIWPDMLVGRLPANTLAQAQAMFDKTVAYEQSMRGAAWNSELLFVADDPDSAGDFWAQSDAMIGGFMPWPYTATRHYYLQTCSTGLQCKQNIANTLNTTGSLIVNYIGHGATAMWSGQRIFDLAGIDLLTNADRWPIMLPMTCLEGYFIDPRTIMPSLAESLVRAINKGAVASWSPTGLGVTQGHEPLDQGFFRAVFYDGVRELGLAAYLGKLNLYTTGSNLEQIEEYTLFGDPALHINALDADVSAHKTVSAPANPMPGDQLLYILTFANAGPATAHGVILTDLLPAGLVNPTVVYQTPNVVGTLPGADYTWQIADLAPGETGEIRVQATIDPMREPPFALANQVSIAMNEPDLDPANNASTIITPVTHRRPTDLQIGKAVQTPPEPQPGDLFTYTLTFTNAGPGAAHGVVITDLIPTLLLDPVVVYTSPEVVGLRPG
ncbi:MAG: DUF11 domain-containing protein, partial [Anaerolineae bacterium]|nr:DUF11 domain-containing protein [Anaerolineae bacterium]